MSDDAHVTALVAVLLGVLAALGALVAVAIKHPRIRVMAWAMRACYVLFFSLFMRFIHKSRGGWASEVRGCILDACRAALTHLICYRRLVIRW